jgi:hypothetical protein
MSDVARVVEGASAAVARQGWRLAREGWPPPALLALTLVGVLPDPARSARRAGSDRVDLRRAFSPAPVGLFFAIERSPRTRSDA